MRRDYKFGQYEEFTLIKLSEFTLDEKTGICLDGSLFFAVSQFALYADSAGTLEIPTVDYAAEQDKVYTAKESEEGGSNQIIYKAITITNPIYAGVDIWVSGNNFGSYTNNTEMLNRTGIEATTGEAITRNVFCYVGVDTKLYKGDNRELLKSIISGVAVKDADTSEEVLVRNLGVVPGFIGLVAGQKYYLGNTGNPVLRGELLDGEQIVQVGIAKSATELQLQIMPPEKTQGSWFNAEIGDIKYSAVYEDKRDKGWYVFDYNNAISQANYSALFAKIGHMYNAQHVEAGDADLSGSSTLFYPTPVPGKFGRIGLPDISFTDADISDSAGNLRINGTGLSANTRYGTAFKFEVITGTAPTGLVDGVVYYGAFGADYILLHPTEQDAINTTARISFTDSGLGTFRLTQEGIALDDAYQKHYLEIVKNTAAGSVAIDITGTSNSGEHASKDTTNYGTNLMGRNHLEAPNSGAPRTSNETRVTMYTKYGYVKVESVTPSGEPVSALRYDTGWILKSDGDWTDVELLVTHNLSSDIDGLIIKFILKTGSGDVIEPIVTNGPGENNRGVSAIGGNLNSFVLHTGRSGFYFIQGTGYDYGIDIDTVVSYKVIVIKPNLIGTIATVDTLTVTDDYTITSEGLTVNVDASSASITVQDGFPVGSKVKVRKINSGTGIITINASGLETFTKAALVSTPLTSDGDFCELEKVTPVRWDIVDGLNSRVYSITTDIGYSNGWTAFSETSYKPKIVRENNRCHMSGVLNSGTVNVLAFTIPEEIRPATKQYFSTIEGVSPYNSYLMGVNETGEVILYGSATNYRSIACSWIIGE